jgi:hypothetical protein
MASKQDSKRFVHLVRSRRAGHSSRRVESEMGDKRSNAILCRWPKAALVTLALAVGSFALAASSAAAATNFTWTGASALGETKWSNGVNWEGTAPSGSVGTLTFPALTSAACTANPAKATCYQSENDVGGLSVNAISIDDAAAYHITGNAITLGSGGITASTSSSSFLSVSPPAILAPVMLGASQTWSIDGNNVNAQLELEGNVSGSSSALAVKLAHGTFLGLRGDVEVGPVSVTGANTFSGWVALGDLQVAAKLNASDGNSISFSEGAGLFAVDATTAPLTFSGGELQVGEAPGGGTVHVVGGVTFDSTSTFQASISKPGTSAGTDYTQLSASGTVKLGEAKLGLYGVAFPEGGGTGHCPTLKVGDVDTLLTTTGTLEGTFTGVSNGTEVQVSCSPGTPPTARINYTEHAVTATITAPGSGGKPTTTTLSASPESPATNQHVTLTATVSANAGGPPAGTVSFANNGVPIPGCEHQPLSPFAPYTATCETTFVAASSPEALTAGFTPSFGSELEGSTSPTDNLAVGKDSTSTALGVSATTPAIGASVTYTATVTPGHVGSTEPSGPVQFVDNGAPIGSCASQPLTQGGSSSSAACTLSYSAAGKHNIKVVYGGDANFTGSTAPEQEVTVQASSGGGTGTSGSNTGAGGGGVLGSKSVATPILGQRQTATVFSGTVTVRANGTSTFAPISGSTSVPDGSEIDATNGRVTITAASANGGTVSAEVYGGRFRVHQDRNGETHLTLTLALTGCPRVRLPKGSAAALAYSAKRRSGPKSRHLWVSETGGKWGTNGRFVSTSVEGTTWLTVDECTQSQVKVTAGKVKVRDLVRKKTKTVSAGKQYVAKKK